MRRVVVTGMGIVSSIGNTLDDVRASLRNTRSGIVAAPEYAELGFRCQVHAAPDIDWEAAVDRRAARFLAQGTAFGHIAMEQAIADSGLTEAEVSHEMTGLIVGSGGPSTKVIIESAAIAREKGPKRVGPFAVPKAMSSGVSAVLSTWFKIRGINYSISSACATSTHCIGAAYEQIAMGNQDVIFAGGSEELHWTLSVLFDAMGAMSSNFNDRPAVASRAPAYWCSRTSSVPRREARKSTARSSATLPIPTASTWSPPRARALCGACAWPCPERVAAGSTT
jgi:3-oxoacyl-[acyl-carrier-protein] synthase-1